MIRWIGSKYGGWNIDIDKIPEKGTIISAGLGNDFSFEEELIRLKGCFIIGIDPTNLTYKTMNKKKLKNFWLIRNALYVNNGIISMTKADTNGASIYDNKPKTKVACITLEELLKTYKDISVLKMNIEGAEYSIINNLHELSISQVLIRFHHRKPNVPFEYSDSVNCIKKLKSFGYKANYMSSYKDPKIDFEVLFIL